MLRQVREQVCEGRRFALLQVEPVLYGKETQRKKDLGSPNPRHQWGVLTSLSP